MSVIDFTFFLKRNKGYAGANGHKISIVCLSMQLCKAKLF